jgi:hypothetical protein
MQAMITWSLRSKMMIAVHGNLSDIDMAGSYDSPGADRRRRNAGHATTSMRSSRSFSLLLDAVPPMGVYVRF